MSRHYQVAIIGAGFCGTMVAINLAKTNPGLSIALIDRHPAGFGLAYGTIDQDHLLNVRAAQMGAFADDPRHFYDWLQTGSGKNLLPGITEKSFVPRKIYGQYLQSLLHAACVDTPALTIHSLDIISIRRNTAGTFDLITQDGQAISASHVVLALGNFLPGQSAALNPYMPDAWQKLSQPGDVLIIGTGLTALDLVVTLARTKPSGQIHLLSRHGLLPREHIDPVPYKLTWRPPYPATTRSLCRKLRAEISAAGKQGIPWQAVIDALRPLNQSLWQNLPLAEQSRFLRHLRAYWDAHRHRCAPQIMDIYRGLEKRGRIRLHHGSIVSETRNGQTIDVIWRPRGKTQTEKLTVEYVVRATGPQADFGKLPDPLVQNLLRQGLIASDALRLGVASTGLYLPSSFDGETTPGLYMLGSLMKGRLYESVAVPELRRQAADVASLIARKVTS